MKAMTLRLPDYLHEQLRIEAFQKRTTITALILEALRERNFGPKGVRRSFGVIEAPRSERSPVDLSDPESFYVNARATALVNRQKGS